MLSYFKFTDLWEDLPSECESDEYLNVYLSDTYWRSVLTEDEIKTIFPMVIDMRDARTFSDFLEAAQYMPEAFVDIFKISEKDVCRWTNSQSAYPERLKKMYAFMICTNYLEYNRFRVCDKCATAFLSRELEQTCDCCKQHAHEAYVMQDEQKEQAVKIQIELVCKAD